MKPESPREDPDLKDQGLKNQGLKDQDLRARERRRWLRLLVGVQIADIGAGIAAYYSAGIFNVPGEVAGLPVLEFVGLALIVIGAVGLLGITALAARTKGK